MANNNLDFHAQTEQLCRSFLLASLDKQVEQIKSSDKYRPSIMFSAFHKQNEIITCLIPVARDFDARYFQPASLANLVENWDSQKRSTPDPIKSNYNKILQGFFDIINWDSIVAMFAFLYSLSKQLLAQNRVDDIDALVDLTVSFASEHLRAWVLQQGGWTGLLDSPQSRNSGRSTLLDKVMNVYFR